MIAGAGGDLGSNVRQQQSRIDVRSGGPRRINNALRGCRFSTPPLGCLRTLSHWAHNEEFDSRTVKWRAGQDETANTYVIAIAV